LWGAQNKGGTPAALETQTGSERREVARDLVNGAVRVRKGGVQKGEKIGSREKRVASIQDERRGFSA